MNIIQHIYNCILERQSVFKYIHQVYSQSWFHIQSRWEFTSSPSNLHLQGSSWCISQKEIGNSEASVTTEWTLHRASSSTVQNVREHHYSGKQPTGEILWTGKLWYKPHIFWRINNEKVNTISDLSMSLSKCWACCEDRQCLFTKAGNIKHKTSFLSPLVPKLCNLLCRIAMISSWLPKNYVNHRGN